jgi:hypothetical protein
MTTPDIRAALLALALIPTAALATEIKCVVVQPVPARCIFGPAGAGFPEGTMVLRCEPPLPQAKEAKS